MLYNVFNPHGGDIYNGSVKLDFSANTNPFGVPDAVRRAIADAACMVDRYPDPYCRKLTEALAGFENVKREYIFCGNGAADIIYSYCEAVHPRTALELAPTFLEYASALEKVGCRVLRHTLEIRDDFALTESFLECLNRYKPETVFLCNPNNPTGRLIESGLLFKVLEECRKLNIRLFVDECFMDFTVDGISVKSKLSEYKNLIILKAFTKSYGMAGVRLGYCMTSDSELLRRMSETVQPWNVSLLAQEAGIAALNETEFLKRTVELVCTERKWLAEKLRSMGFHVTDSSANFILFKAFAGLDIRLREMGVAIRNCSNYKGLEEGFYRIAVRMHHENESLVSAIKKVMTGR